VLIEGCKTISATPSKATAKVQLFCEICKFYCDFLKFAGLGLPPGERKKKKKLSPDYRTSYNQFDAEAAGGGFFDEFLHLRTEGSTGGIGQRRGAEVLHHEIQCRHAGEFGVRQTQRERTERRHVGEEHLLDERISQFGFLGDVVLEAAFEQAVRAYSVINR